MVAALVAAMSWLIAALVGGGAGAATAAARGRTVDRTLLCSLPLHAGLRKITAYATAAVPGQDDVTGSKRLAEVLLSTGGIYGGGLAGITAGRRPNQRSSTFWIGREYCSPSRIRIPMSARGLDGGAASPFGDSYECFPPRRILIRARAIFPSATFLRRGSETFWTPTPVERGYVAARTLSGKPLVFAEIRASGGARLFVAPGCIAE